MKIALINENSQAAKNALIEARSWSRWATRSSTTACMPPMMPPS